MCWGCNPLCGGCRPPRQKAVSCPVCGRMNIVDIQQRGRPTSLACEACGHDITEHSVSRARACERFGGVICANPCGLAAKLLEGANPGKCLNRVEPDEWHQLDASACSPACG